VHLYLKISLATMPAYDVKKAKTKNGIAMKHSFSERYYYITDQLQVTDTLNYITSYRPHPPKGENRAGCL
jgi:hypothetical protein